jgi:hypothetical protein
MGPKMTPKMVKMGNRGQKTGFTGKTLYGRGWKNVKK